jgi:hemerythrin
MIHQHSQPDYQERLQREHKVLAELLQSTRVAVESAETSEQQLRRLILEIVHRVCGHFWHEEKDGYMRPVIEAAPQLAHAAEELRAQHAHLLDELESLRQLVESPASATSGKPEQARLKLRDAYQQFLRHYMAHEAAEDALMQEAFQSDVAAGD